MPYQLLTASGLDYLRLGAAGEIQDRSANLPARLGAKPSCSDLETWLRDPRHLCALREQSMVLELRDGSTLYVLRRDPRRTRSRG